MPTSHIYRRLALAGTLCLASVLAQAQTVRVVVAESRVLAEPQDRAALVTTVPRGIFLEVAEALDGGWIMVRMPGGKKLGFVNSKDVEHVAPAVAPAPATRTDRPVRARTHRGPRLAASLGWIYAPSRIEFSESRSFTKYREDTGKLDIAYRHPKGSGFAVDFQWNVRAGFGLQAGYSDVRRTGSSDLAAQVPHPLYFQRNRAIASKGDDLVWNESAIHVDAAYARRVGPLRASLFAGVGFFTVNADLVEKLVFTHKYPYNATEVAVSSMPSQPVSANAVGPDFGLSIEAPLHRHFGLGALLRYSAARVKLQRPQPTAAADEDKDVTGPQVLRPASDTAIAVDAGGLRLGVGLRVYF